MAKILMSSRRMIVAGSCLFMAVCILFLSLQQAKIPDRELLASATANVVEHVIGGRHGNITRFHLDGQDNWFVYRAVGGGVEEVQDTVKNYDGSVSIRYDQNKFVSSSLFENRAYRPVYEMTAGDTTLRSYAQVVEGYTRNSNLGKFLSLCFLLLSIVAVIIPSKYIVQQK